MASVPSSTFATSQVTIAPSGQIVAARAGRKRLTLIMGGAVDTFIGNSSGVTVNNGALLLGTKGSTLVLETEAAVFGINASTAVIDVIEEF